MSDRISVLKSVSDCPEAIAEFSVGNKIEEAPLELRLTRPMYPNGKCCFVVTPEVARRAPVRMIYYRTFQANYTRAQVKTFRMFLSDKESSSYFRPYTFNIDGEKLASQMDTLGYVEYKLRVAEEYRLANGPQYPCESWRPGEYDDCLETHFLKKTLSILPCSPPWLTDRSELWCEDHLKLPLPHLQTLSSLLGSQTVLSKVL